MGAQYGGTGGTPPKAGGPAGKVINGTPPTSGGKPPAPPKGTSAHYGDFGKK